MFNRNTSRKNEQYIDCRGKELSPKTLIIISKILAFVIGLSCLAVAFLARYFGGLLQVTPQCEHTVKLITKILNVFKL